MFTVSSRAAMRLQWSELQNIPSQNSTKATTTEVWPADATLQRASPTPDCYHKNKTLHDFEKIAGCTRVSNPVWRHQALKHPPVINNLMADEETHICILQLASQSLAGHSASLHYTSYLSLLHVQMQVILGHRWNLEVRQLKSHFSGPRLAQQSLISFGKSRQYCIELVISM